MRTVITNASERATYETNKQGQYAPDHAERDRGRMALT
jgi:hypothetical protein